MTPYIKVGKVEVQLNVDALKEGWLHLWNDVCCSACGSSLLPPVGLLYCENLETRPIEATVECECGEQYPVHYKELPRP